MLFTKLANTPFLWDIFEYIFGADKQKGLLYRSKLPKKVGALMDFGCATGNTTGAFLDCNYLGVDVDKASIQCARKKWSKYSNIKFVNQDITKKNRLGEFDTILFAGTGHHLSDAILINIFRSLDNYLQPKGSIYYFDTIKPVPGEPIVARWLCHIDRGRHIRSRKHSLRIMKNVKDIYKTKNISTEQISGTFLPQPAYLYIKLSKK